MLFINSFWEMSNWKPAQPESYRSESPAQPRPLGTVSRHLVVVLVSITLSTFEPSSTTSYSVYISITKSLPSNSLYWVTMTFFRKHAYHHSSYDQMENNIPCVDLSLTLIQTCCWKRNKTKPVISSSRFLRKYCIFLSLWIIDVF